MNDICYVLTFNIHLTYNFFLLVKHNSYTFIEISLLSIPKVKYVDIVCYNRYYSWYSDSGYLDLISYQLDREMQLWHNMTGKLLLMTEYGADAVAGLYQV